MLQHVLVPLDGSRLAETALEYAERLVGPGAKITLLTVVQAPEVPLYDFYPMPATLIHEYESSLNDALPFAQEYLARIAVQLQSTLNIETNTLVEVGQPENMIVEVAERLNVDAVVISTHGRSGLNRWLFGSVTQKVLAVATCPVFVIPNRRPHEQRDETRVAATA
jgi:nucleotide-binding universal stress UspA family protein